jgi:acylphosphatase
MRNVEILIKGRVQGVGFRYHTCKAAEEFNINGFVRNLPDRSVYILATGVDDDMEKFINWCHFGPGMAMVESVKVKDTTAIEYNSFSIK